MAKPPNEEPALEIDDLDGVVGGSGNAPLAGSSRIQKHAGASEGKSTEAEIVAIASAAHDKHGSDRHDNYHAAHSAADAEAVLEHEQETAGVNREHLELERAEEVAASRERRTEQQSHAPAKASPVSTSSGKKV